MDSLLDSDHAKREFRRDALQRRRELSEVRREEAAGALLDVLRGLDSLRGAERVMAYSARGGELSLEPFMEWTLDRGAEVLLPRVDDQQQDLEIYRIEDLERDREPGYGDILEPVRDRCEQIPPDTLEVVLVPGVLFDEQGYRIGYGGGFYDRFLSGIPDDVVTLGIAYEFQIRTRLPRMDHDVPVDRIVTDSGTVIDA